MFVYTLKYPIFNDNLVGLSIFEKKKNIFQKYFVVCEIF